MRGIALLLIVVSAILLVSTWLLYPRWLRLRSRGRPAPKRTISHRWWPSVTIVVVVRNAEATLRSLLENLVSQSYPGDRRHILVVSDASTDFTDAIARTFEHRGVKLLRIMRRRGVASALNYARKHVRDDIVVQLHPDARLAQTTLMALVAPFVDPGVGVTYGHEQQIEVIGARRGRRESPYTRYERILRERESRVFGTVSARGTLYAVRGPLFLPPIPAWANPDFMAVLLAAENGYSAQHVSRARCVLTRPRSLKRHYARTVECVARDALTLMRRPQMLLPGRYGDFAWMLLGHKVARWLTPWAIIAGFVGLLLLAPSTEWARLTTLFLLGAALGASVLALIPGRTRLLRTAALPGHVATTAVAILHASVTALRARTALRRGLEPVLT